MPQTDSKDIRSHLPHGAQTALAERFDVDLSYVNKVLADRRPHVGTKIKKAAARLAKPRRAFKRWFPPPSESA